MAPSEVIDLEYVSIGVSQLVNVFACSKEGHYKCQKLMAYYFTYLFAYFSKNVFQSTFNFTTPSKNKLVDYICVTPFRTEHQRGN